MVTSIEERLLQKVEKLLRTGDVATSAFVAEQLRGILQRELEALGPQQPATAEERGQRADLLRRIADVQLTVGETATALRYYQQVLAMDPDGPSAARTHARLGEQARLGAQWKDANAHFDQGIRIFQKHGFEAETAQLLVGKGYVAWRQGRQDAAQRLMDEAKALAQRLDAKPTLANVAIELGNLANDRGDINRARACYQEAVETLKSLEPSPVLARAYNNLGDTHIKVKDWEGAIPYFEETLRIARRIRDKQWMGWGAFNAAECYCHIGQPRRAKEYCDLALQMLTDKGDKIGLANVSVNYGIAYRFLGEWAEMVRYFEEGIAHYEELGLDPVAAYSCLEYAQGLVDKGDKAAALVWARKAVNKYRKAGATVYQQEAQQLLDELRKGHGAKAD